MKRAGLGSRAGFTLIEVMVVLLLAGAAAKLAHHLFAATLDAGAQLTQAVHAADREQNAGRLLAAMLLSVAVGTEGDQPFEGRPDRMRFSAWLETPEGWFERRAVDLSFTGGRFEAAITPGSSLLLSDSVSALRFEYLLELGAESRWVSEWVSPVTAPLAVRLSLSRRSRG